MDQETKGRDLQTVDLVRLTREGHEDAAKQLFERYGDRVLKIVRMRLGREQRISMDSVDVRQQVFAEAFRTMDNFTMHDESSLIRWLAVMVKHRILGARRHDHSDKRDRRLEVSLDANTAPLPIPAALPTPSMEVGRAEEAEVVRDCIAQLEERHREVVLLRDYSHASWEVVAEELGLPSAGAARMMHGRALQKLGQLMRQRGLE